MISLNSTWTVSRFQWGGAHILGIRDMSEENYVGRKIRQLRESRGLSVADLAEHSCSPVALIERIEAGELVPSLAPLLKIARGLGVRLGTFLDDMPQTGPVVVRGGRSGHVMRFSGKCDSSRESRLEFFSLASDKGDRHMEPFVIDVHPPTSEACKLSSHEGEEFIYVLAGQIDVVYGQERYALQAGDSIYYDSIVPHDVHAGAGQDARILAVVYAPY